MKTLTTFSCTTVTTSTKKTTRITNHHYDLERIPYASRNNSIYETSANTNTNINILMTTVEHVLLHSCVVAYGVRCSITGGRRERDFFVIPPL
jgi:hypothetical protein